MKVTAAAVAIQRVTCVWQAARRTAPAAAEAPLAKEACLEYRRGDQSRSECGFPAPYGTVTPGRRRVSGFPVGWRRRASPPPQSTPGPARPRRRSSASDSDSVGAQLARPGRHGAGVGRRRLAPLKGRGAALLAPGHDPCPSPAARRRPARTALARRGRPGVESRLPGGARCDHWRRWNPENRLISAGTGRELDEVGELQSPLGEIIVPVQPPSK